MKKPFWHKSVLFLLTIVFAMVGIGAFAGVVAAKTLTEYANDISTATTNKQVAQQAVTDAQEAHDEARAIYDPLKAAYDSAKTTYDSAKTTYDSTMTIIRNYYISVYPNFSCTTTTDEIALGQCAQAEANLQPYTEAFDTATTNLAGPKATFEAASLALQNANTALTAANTALTAANTASANAQAAAGGDSTSGAATAAAGAGTAISAIPTEISQTVSVDAQALAGGTQSSCASGQQTTTSTSSTDATTGVTTTTAITYDSCGAISSMKVYTSSTDASGNKTTTTQSYDASGNTVGEPTTSTTASTSTSADEDKLLKSIKGACTLNPLAEEPNGFAPCLALVPYYFFYKPASILLSIAGLIFDTSITLSIDKYYVADPPFIGEIWTIIRDFSNMIFIFILLYTGIQTILGIGSWQKTVINVIIIALLINFSLFFTKVVIDAGNILSVGIFQAMGVEKTNSSNQIALSKGTLKERSLSQAIVGQFMPGKFMKEASGVGTFDAVIILIVATIINGFAAYVLFKVALLFIGRLLAFWFLMIISPFAFISFVMPKGNIFGWWSKTLMDQAFVAPVFLFLFYLLMTIINSGIMSSFAGTSIDVKDFLFKGLLGPVLVAAMLITALKYILKITEDMAGTFGSMASEYAMKALSLTPAGRVMSMGVGGAVGMLAQKTIGKAAYRATAESDWLKGKVGTTKWGSMAFTGLEKAAGAGFGAKGSMTKTVSEAKSAAEARGKKIAVGKDGKPIMVTDSTGKQITVTEAYAARLKKGTFAGEMTGANIGKKEAAAAIGKKEKKSKEVEQKKKQKEEKVAAFRKELGLTEKDERTLDQLETETDTRIEELEAKVAESKAAIKAISETDVVAQAGATASLMRAERKLKKFEGARTEIEKIENEIEKGEGKLKELGETKKSEPKEEKKGAEH